MNTPLFFKSFPLWVIFLFLLAWGSFAFGDEIQYAAGFTPEKVEITLGEPMYLTFNLTNMGSEEIMMRVSAWTWELWGVFRIQAFDASGAKVPDEYGDGNSVKSGVVGWARIKPGSVYVDRLFLPKFIKFKQPGEYTVVMSRGLDVVNFSGSTNLLRNGSLSSDDGLNWVDTFLLPITPVGRFIPSSNPIQSFSRITNRFELTVLPADKDRLLKRAQEILAKLDGIGARDVVAKPNGPRALDRKLDWDTVMSAWLVGADNVDLHEAVQVLSNIGDRRIIPDLKRHLNDTSMKVRFACVKVLCALGEPLRAEWIVPIIQSRQWWYYDEPEDFVVKHGGADAASILIECMNLTDPSVTNVWNYRLTNIIKKPGIQELNYHYNYEENYAGTPQEIQENAKVLNQLQDWLKSHPVSN